MSYPKNKNENYDNRGGINDKSSRYLTQKGQFLDIRNFGFEKIGAFVSRPGIGQHASLNGSSYFTNPYGMVQYRKDNGFSQIVFDVGNQLYYLGGGITSIATSLSPNVTTGYPIDYEIGDNVLYYANGYTFQRYDGSFSSFYNIPTQRTFMLGAGLTFNTSLGAIGFTAVLAAGEYQFKYAYKRGTGDVEGIVGERVSDDLDVGINVPFLNVSLSATLVTSNGKWLVYGLTVTNGYGISSILPYMDLPFAGTSFIAGPTAVAFFATTYSGMTLYTMQFNPYDTPVDYQNQFNFTLVPSYLEVYKNMLFMAGFSSMLSTVWHSEIAQYEQVDPENFIEVRTGNSDKITNMTLFQDNIIIFKYRSVHAMSGDSPETLSLKDMNLQYGCVNNGAAVVWENKLWFMDSKGICNFDGPNTAIVSYAVEAKLNQVDKNTCRAFYIKKRSEVWFCCDGVCFVYNHDVNAWSIYDNIPIRFTRAAQILEFVDDTIDLSFFVQGSSYISLNRFDDTLHTDLGQPMTLMATSKFFQRENETTQEIWRRLFFNSNITSVTTSCTLLMIHDYGTSVIYATNIFLDDFQTRIDFGVSARSLQIQFILRATEEVSFYGFTVESRYLRNV